MIDMRFAFFGTPDIAVHVLTELAQAGYLPSLIVTNPDAPVGRKQVLTPPPVKAWATSLDIPVIQPTNLKDPANVPELHERFDIFIVAAYGKIIPKWVLDIPLHGTVNVHPSLLPKLRGASPIRSAILQDIRDTGVTIMQMDTELDHGPIVAQAPADISPAQWPLPGQVLDQHLATLGGQLLVTVLPNYLAGNCTPTPQNHAEATFCTKITKDMGQLELDPYNLPQGEVAYRVLLKIRAFDGWPGTFFFHNDKRVKITAANLSQTGALEIISVIPEGKKEQPFTNYLQSISINNL